MITATCRKDGIVKEVNRQDRIVVACLLSSMPCDFNCFHLHSQESIQGLCKYYNVGVSSKIPRGFWRQIVEFGNWSLQITANCVI